ncbi:MAG: tetratricopeptide repeat protein [Pyrinomonadaceae bacterium]|nr:tetratricopeptide repeat protein [Pyrinomonadaceae bacterium]
MYKREYQLLVFLTILLLSGCTSISSADNEIAGTRPKIEPSEALQKAQGLYDQRKDLDKVREAIKLLEKARDPDNRNFDVEWKFAQFSYFLGSRENIDETEAQKVLKRGLTSAKIAKRLEPSKPDGYFWYAAILGNQSKRSPVTVGVVSIKKIRQAMKKVIEIDPNYQGASAYDGLGQLELGSRGLGGGSAEKAVEYLEKALELNKENSYIRLHLGEAYLAVNKDAEAKKQLQYVLAMKADPDFIPEHEEAKAKAKKLLEQKF